MAFDKGRNFVLATWALVFLLAAIALIGASARAQQTAASATTQATGAPTPSASSDAAAAPARAIALAEVATRAEATFAELRDIEAQLAADETTRTIADELPALIREIDPRLSESAKLLAAKPSLEILRTMVRAWQTLDGTLSEWDRELADRAASLDRTSAQLSRHEKTWAETLGLAKAAEVPTEVLRRIDSLIGAIKRTHDALENRTAQILSLQNRVALQHARVSEALASVKQARDNVVNRIFTKDSLAIWSEGVVALARASLANDSRQSWSTQVATLQAYAERSAGQFLLHAAIFALLTAILYWIRRQARYAAAQDSSMQRAAAVFAMPVATALVLSAFVSGWIYPHAPRLLWALVGAVALIPTILILRRLMARELLPVLYAVVGFYFVDQVRAVVASWQAVPRLLFLIEMLCGVVFLLWLLARVRPVAGAPREQKRLRKTMRIGAYAALVFFAATGIATALGYVTLANLLGNAVLDSAYLGVILCVVVAILDGLIAMALRVRPLVLLGMVRRHPELLRQRVHSVLTWGAVALWALYALERLALRERVMDSVRALFTAALTFGAISISLGDVIAFGVTVWASFLLSRFVRFILDEDIYPRVHLERGLPYAISQTLHYLILVTGFLLAVAALGFDMTKFTILAGAFTVGVGFGLQNIFNNFVSGLILLFERPVQVGDVVQIDDASGVVERIGIRASSVRTSKGSELIVPNGKLISERLINWTSAHRQRGMEIPVAVATGTDPQRMIELLNEVAASHPHVRTDPPPQTLLVKLGPDSLGFELRVWMTKMEEWEQTRSELSIAISSALAREQIAIK